MLINPRVKNDNSLIKIEKYVNNKNASKYGAFSQCDEILIRISVSRRFSLTNVSVEFFDDFGMEKTSVCEFFGISDGFDIYICRVKAGELRPDGGVVFWRVCGEGYGKKMYSQTPNNLDVYLCDNAEGKKFRLLVYADGFCTPEWAKKSVMYQIFPDRFNRGSVEIPCRSDAVPINDWENGIPEYPTYNGAPMKNNSFFGGTLYGIAEKLEYLERLGVNIIYLCPIFKAYSNHKYDTGDYETVDEMFGGEKAFELLVSECEKRKIRLILDGVFNHTGDDSKYFNKYGKYEKIGAYQSKNSEYYDWYTFTEFPNKYSAWWGIEILPRINGDCPAVRKYFLSENGIVRDRLKRGVSGWRLDVADELSAGFLEELRTAAKAEKSDCLIIGEVWENAAEKIAYGERKRYFAGKQLDSVMNYPIKNAVVDYVMNGDAGKFYNETVDIYSSYPEFCSSVLMNILGTHDTERILTVLGGVGAEGKSNAELSTMKMSKSEREKGIKRLKTASVLQFTLPGIPSIYYGDEAGMEGYHDPFCRRPFPWGREDGELLSHYKRLCEIKKTEKSLHDGNLSFLYAENGVVVFERNKITVVANCSAENAEIETGGEYADLLTGKRFTDVVSVLSGEACILKAKK